MTHLFVDSKAFVRILTGTLMLLLSVGASSRAQFSIVVDAQKDPFYSGLRDSVSGFIHIPHSAFLPISGPSPSGESDLSADVWVAWDDQYFYLYAEVADDIVQVSSRVRPWNDCLELKFDPDPRTKPLTGILNARLTALDRADASEAQGVDNLYPERDSLLSLEASQQSNYARRLTANGYALELRLKWDWIRCGGRAVRAGVGNVFGLAVTVHDNDGEPRPPRAMERDGSIQWSAGMADEVWLVPQLLGTMRFAADHRLSFVRQNAIDPSDVRTKTFLSLARFKQREGYFISIENWRYHSGDSSHWSTPAYDDRDWEITFARLRDGQRPKTGWDGIGWFRAQLVVDSSLWGVPLSLHVSHSGASEVYLDGSLLYQYGTVGSSAEAERRFRGWTPRPIVFAGPGVHSIAIRYSNTATELLNALKIDAAFGCSFGYDLDARIASATEFAHGLAVAQTIFVLLPLVIGALHILLFLFYPRTRENLTFALFMFCWAFIVFQDFQGAVTADVVHHVVLQRFVSLAIGGALIFGMLTIYLSISQSLPRQFYFSALIIGIVAGCGLLYPAVREIAFIMYGVIGLLALEVFRVFMVQWQRKSRQKWITALGVSLFVISLFWQILYGMEYLPGIGGFALIYACGLLALSVCVSVDLSRTFARTTKDLERQLVHVNELSEQALVQERRAKEEELARRLLEADNARKTRELDAARQVQLSMLPKELPALPHLDIAVRMETAAEVGGDYYDFHLAENGILTIAVGDATGHGTKAGTMVSISKGLFHELAGLESLTTIFEKFTTAFRHMKLGELYMGLLLVRISGHSVTASAAGMPPIYVFRAATHSTERLVMKGMPLGQFVRFPYQTREFTLSAGDTLLLMSDGLAEMFNEANETFDENRVADAFARVAARSPQDIIDHLFAEGQKWASGRPQADDVTLMVLKVR